MKFFVTFLIHPKRWPTLAGKLLARLGGEPALSDSRQAWLQAQCQNTDDFFSALDSQLWQAATEAENYVRERYRAATIPDKTQFGGGADIRILYFLTRYLDATCILETGVASGHSSQALLMALEANGGEGVLYSSDLPYVRMGGREEHIGWMVEDRFRPRWKLYTDGDRANLAAILREAQTFDLFHYDSDKSVSGRSFAYNLLKSRMTERGVILFDDIEDNDHFMHLALAEEGKSHFVFKKDRKYVGMIGFPTRRAATPMI